MTTVDSERAPFHLDAGNASIAVHPGPWGVAINTREYLSSDPGWQSHHDVGITLTSEDATRLAAALILAAATAASYDTVQPDPPAESNGETRSVAGGTSVTN